MSKRRQHKFVEVRPANEDWGDPELTSGHLISAGDKTVAVMRGTMSHGLSKSGKKWQRWVNREATIFSMKSGRMRVYSIVKEPRKRNRIFRDITSSNYGLGTIPSRGEVGETFAAEYNREFGLTVGSPDNNWVAGPRWLREDFLPALQLNPTWQPVQGVPGAMRATTGREMITAELGASRYRKDVLKALASSQRLEGLKVAKALRRDFPIDWLVPVVAWPTRNELAMLNLEELRHFLVRLPERQARLLIADLPNVRETWLRDTLRMGHALNAIPRTYTWNALHDELAPAHRAYAPRAVNEAIKQTGPSAKLDGLTLEGIELRSAKTTDELLGWGDEMHHCIGSYGYAAVQGESHLFGLFEGDKMVANLELTPTASVRQFYGKYNARPDLKTEIAVTKAIEKKWKEKA